MQCLLSRTVDDGDEHVGLDDGTEVKAAGSDVGGVNEDDIEACKTATWEGLEGMGDAATSHHCKRKKRCKS